MRSYRTIQGDTWDIIAYREYQSERLMSALLEANPDYVDVVIFPAGIVLNVPEVELSVPSTLPPWAD